MIREDINKIFDNCYAKSTKHLIFQRQKALNEIISYLKNQIEQMGNPNINAFRRAGYEDCKRDILIKL